MIFSDLSRHFHDYKKMLPLNMKEVAVKSAAFSFAFAFLFTQELGSGFAAGILAATVSLVNSATMPFFRHIFADALGYINWYEHAFGQIVALAASQVLYNSLTPYRVNLLGGAFFTIGLSLLINGFHDHSTYFSSEFIFV